MFPFANVTSQTNLTVLARLPQLQDYGKGGRLERGHNVSLFPHGTHFRLVGTKKNNNKLLHKCTSYIPITKNTMYFFHDYIYIYIYI